MPDQNLSLPYMNISVERSPLQYKDNKMVWFVPQIGAIRMYNNPTNFHLTQKKNIRHTQTKGGYSIGYFGETLPALSISGTTSIQGIEGINVLEQIYRAEQHLFDSNAVMINAANNQTLATQIGNYIGTNTGTDFSGLSNIIDGSDQFGLQQLNSRDMVTLADIAFGIELYYNGSVYRGFFDSFGYTETPDFLIKYDMSFMITKTSGMRLNHLPWQQSPVGTGSSKPSFNLSQPIKNTLT